MRFFLHEMVASGERSDETGGVLTTIGLDFREQEN
jgi:hypothetical protein